MKSNNEPKDSQHSLEDLKKFGLIDAVLGSIDFRGDSFSGAEIPDGVFAYRSKHNPLPLTEMEKMLILTACGSGNGWHYMHIRAESYKPSLSNYSAAAGGRTFPSAAGFHTSMTFFTDDDEVYVLNCRDAPSAPRNDDGSVNLEDSMDSVRKSIKKIQGSRLMIPNRPPFVEPHNTWVANGPGSMLVIPVADVAQHVLLGLCYLLQNGIVVKDDINNRPIPTIEKFKDIVDVNNALPITFLDQLALLEISAELSTSCYAGALMLQAMGLGGWMYDGIDPFTVLGASGDPAARGLGFRFDTNQRWPYPNPTGLEGMHGRTLSSALRRYARGCGRCSRTQVRPGRPVQSGYAGSLEINQNARSSAQVHNEEFKECVALQAQYIFDTFGKFPATIPSIMCSVYLQAHHLDLDFYDHFFERGAYLKTHADHMRSWH